MFLNCLRVVMACSGLGTFFMYDVHEMSLSTCSFRVPQPKRAILCLTLSIQKTIFSGLQSQFQIQKSW